MPRTSGALRARLKFQRRPALAEPDQDGNQEGAWADLNVERLCDLKPTRGGEEVLGARLSGTALWDCWVRSDTGTRSVKTGDRAVDVRDATRAFNVRFNEDMNGDNRWRLIQLESGVADG